MPMYDVPMITQKYVLLSEYNKLKESKQKEIDELQSNKNSLNETIKKLQNDVAILTKQINELEKIVSKQNMEMNELKQIKHEYDEMKLYQKIADNLSDIFDDFYNVFKETGIFNESNDTDLYYLAKHLCEVSSNKFTRHSRVQKDLEKWKKIYNDAVKILNDEFKIDDINVFFEIVSIKEYRNSISHKKEAVTIEEIAQISNYSKQIWNCIHQIQ